ncbi:ketopantoate reductase family protein [bacterium]|nr:ketopantoate reductase family protein [bacterium]
MKILILGTGAIGSVFGGFLAKSGHQVTLVGKLPHLEVIKQQGLKISGIWGEYLITQNLILGLNLEEILRNSQKSFDLVLICVKSYDTEKIVKEYLPVIKESSYIISLQNGLGNLEIISSLVEKEKIIAARVIFGAKVESPGHVKVTVYADQVMLGSIDNVISFEKLEEVAQIISTSGIPCQATKEINKYLWAKVLYNCSLNGLAAILEVTYGELGAYQETRKIMLDICKEIFMVAKIKKIEFFWERPEEYFDYLINKQIPPTAFHHASMRQDIKNQKKTEIEALNGAIVRLAKEEGLEVPVNNFITSLIKSKEKTYLS